MIKLTFNCGRDEALKTLSDNELVNKNVRFDEKWGKPHIHIKEKKNDRVFITCELLGRGRRDNGFLVGTFFSGKLVEKNGQTVLRGFITTAPIYHLIMLTLIIFFIYRCISLGGISVVPILVVLFNVVLFKDEYKKRGYIKRYLFRAKRRVYENTSNKK